jgi:pimeloyl-ACP methyl ester carboxylesterase
MPRPAAPTPLPYPAIFLPGIMGSVLRDQYPVDPETVWSPLRLIARAYDRITPHPSDPRYELKEPARVAPDRVFEVIYGDFIEELRYNLTHRADRPVPVYPFAYDWRRPLEDVEAQLAAFVVEVVDRTKLLRHYHDAGYGGPRFPAKVHLVGHSMGGLIVAGYLQSNGDALVSKVATLGAPFRGSIEAVAKVAVGVSTLTPVDGGSRERDAARVTPSLYHLLPSWRGSVLADERLPDDLFDPRCWQPGILQSLASFVRNYGLDARNPGRQALALLTQMLERAWKHRQRVERLELADPQRWLCIVGCDAKTRVTLPIRRAPDGTPAFDLGEPHVRNEWRSDDPKRRVQTGDHTVPYLGARAKFIPVEQVVCVTPDDFGVLELKDRLLELNGFHSTLPNLNLAQRLVVSHLRGERYGDVWGTCAPDLPDPAAWDPPIAGLARRQ